jgi:hypothetical protein
MTDQTADDAEPRHLNNHHLDTLGAIFAHPMSHNIRWVDVVSLAGAVGSVEEKHDGKFRIQIGAEVEVFDRPKVKDIDTQQIVDLRRMLHNAGYRPAPPGEEI